MKYSSPRPSAASPGFNSLARSLSEVLVTAYQCEAIMNKYRKLGYYYGYQVKGTTMGKTARRWSKRKHSKLCRRMDRIECLMSN